MEEESKYRIKKIIQTNDLGQSNIQYRLEKRFLWFWIGATYKGIGNQCNAGLEFNNYSSYFNNINDLNFVLEYCKNPYRENYKGHLLKKYISYTGNYPYLIYIDINSIRSAGKYRGFHADISKDILDLKREIDKNIVKIKEEIL